MHIELLYIYIKKTWQKKSAKSYVSLKGNDKAISILQNITKAQTKNKQTKNSTKK